MDTTALVAKNVPAAASFRMQVNQNATLLDLLARGGGGLIGVFDGVDRIALSLPVSGLLLHISAGHAMIGGPVEIVAAMTLAVPDATSRIWIWLNQAGVISYTTTTTPPAGEVCLLGSCVTSGGNVTAVDTSGVMYLRGGSGWRETADAGAPVDTPPASVIFVAKTAGGEYLWTGTAYRGISGGGTVSSVGLTLPSDFTVSGSPVTGSGTLAVTANTQTANTVKAGPASGAAAAPTYRALVAADIPAIPESGVTNLVTDLAAKMANPMTTSGDVIYGASAGAPSRLAGNITATRNFLRQTGTGTVSAAPVWDTLLAADIPNIAESQVTNLTTDLAGKASSTMAVGGDLTGNLPNPTLAAAGPGATGPIGSTTTVPVITIDAKGRVTALTSATIAAGITANQKIGEIAAVFDGGGSVLTVGAKVRVRVAYACTITASTVLVDQSGSIAIEVRKCTYAQYDAGATHPVTADKISATAPPTVTSATKAQDTTLTGWTTAVSAGDIVEFVISSVTTCTWCSITLDVTKS